MKKSLLTSVFLFSNLIAFSQEHTGMEASDTFSEAGIFGLLELPFLIIAIIFSFLTANLLKGGKFGSGMNLLAWGFLIMAIGHLHMQIEHLTGDNFFRNLLGNVAGDYTWYLALILTWFLTALGFYKIYKASKV